MKEPMDMEQKRVLVLCVDRDGDLGAKAEIRTPLIGREKNLNAAVSLALKDPEEPDANAMFEAIRIYDRLKGENKPEEVVEIATLAGSELGGVGADRKIVAEFGELLEAFPATEVVLVTDGYSDEMVLPLVQSRVPVSSVRRVVVKHSERIEETAALFSRYLKTIMENPRYSRVVVGVPGLLILILGVLSIFDLVHLYVTVFGIILSLILLVKGFGIDRSAKGLYKWVKEYSPPPLRVQISTFSAVAGVLCIVLGAYLGWTNAAARILPAPDMTGWLVILPTAIAYFMAAAAPLIVIGVCVALSGRAIRWYLERDVRLLRNVALIVSTAWSLTIFNAASKLLITSETGYGELVFYIVVGTMIGIASVLVVFVVHRSSKGFFRETSEQIEEFES